MAREKNGINYQITQQFKKISRIGESKREAKITGEASSYIYSYKTLSVYIESMKKFAKWCRVTHGVRDVSQMSPYVNEYIQKLRADGASAWTQKRDLAAIGKYYQHSFFKEVETDARHRSQIFRSREATDSDPHFSKDRNRELIDFCRHTGLRRRELEALTGGMMIYQGNQAYIRVLNGKGGRARLVPILDNNKAVIDRMNNTPEGSKVWGKVHSHADIHSYRADYANALYNEIARDTATLDRSEVYHCRNDKAGCWYDKEAMKVVSEALGHSRIDIIAQNYLR